MPPPGSKGVEIPIHRPATLPRLVLLLLPLLVLAAALPASAAFDKSQSFAADSLTVNNLIGEVRISGHAGAAQHGRCDG